MGDTNYDRAVALIPDEMTAVSYFTKMRWPHGHTCPYCRETEIRLSFRTGTYRCIACGQIFSIKAGTIFEGTKLPMRTWLLAIAYVLDHSGAVSGTAMAKKLGVPQKRAWYMLKRLHLGMATPSFGRPLPDENAPRPRANSNQIPKSDVHATSEGAHGEANVASDNAAQTAELDWDDELVEEAFKDFPRPYDERSLWHPSDEHRAREFINKFEGKGSEFDPEAIYRWARRHGLDVASAKLLRSIVREPRKAKRDRANVERYLTQVMQLGSQAMRPDSLDTGVRPVPRKK